MEEEKGMTEMQLWKLNAKIQRNVVCLKTNQNF